MSRFSLTELQEELRQALGADKALTPQVRRALALAFGAHRGQYREQKDGRKDGLPYIVHPVGVAKLAAKLLSRVTLTDCTDDILSSCLTHDVLEDTSVTLRELATQTSDRTAEIVLALTKPRSSLEVSRADRNRVFLSQIANAGATVCFVKVCDAMHNLSWPRAMPEELLLKTIKKARNDYLALADNPHFSSAIRESYEELIRKAELVVHASAASRLPSVPANFDEALSICLKGIQGKVLEEHDIAATIEKVTGTSRAHIGTVREFLGPYGDHAAANESLGTRIKELVSSQTTEQHFTLFATQVDSDTPRQVQFDRILGCSFGGAAASVERKYVIVTLDGSAPQWLTSKTLLALTSVLSQRLLAVRAQRLAHIADELLLLELPLDAGLVQQAQLSHSDLVSLKANIDMATFIHQNLLMALRRLAAQAEVGVHIDRLESRVKSARSIVLKLLIRGFSSVEQLNDFVGVRFIVKSTKALRQLCVFLEQTLQLPASDLGRAVPLVAGSLEIEEVSSPEGYKATHLRFRVLAPSTSLRSVACEIQLRTIFQDAWAHVSQMLLYKKLRDGRDAEEKLLARLVQLRDECDEVIAAAEI